ncbi:hypothetical protein JYU01_02590, partial [bacterium AH-315-L21]|nr:hypothetical protein [bacterium AH-315-L21]
THKDSTTEGKLFVGFISLIIKSYMEYKLKDYFTKNNSSTEKIFRELKKIKIVTVNNGQHLMAPLTSKQKKILNEFNIVEDEIMSYINSI